jgi:hypothetical protein
MAANIGLSILLLHPLGTSGVALGTLIPYAVSGTIMVALGCRTAHMSFLRFCASAVLPSLACALAAGALGFGLQAFQPADTWPLLVLELGVVMAAYAVPVVLISFPVRRTIGLVLDTARMGWAWRPMEGPRPESVDSGTAGS